MSLQTFQLRCLHIQERLLLCNFLLYGEPVGNEFLNLLVQLFRRFLPECVPVLDCDGVLQALVEAGESLVATVQQQACLLHFSAQHLTARIEFAQSDICFALFLLQLLQLFTQPGNAALVEGECIQLFLSHFCVATDILDELSQHGCSGIQVCRFRTFGKGRVEFGIEFPLLHILLLTDADGVQRLFLGVQAALCRCQFGPQFRELLLFGIRLGEKHFVVGLHLADELALVQYRVAVVGMVRRSADRARDPFAQIGAQLDDVLSLAQQIGVFLFLAESLSLAGFHLQLANAVLQVPDVQTQFRHTSASLLDVLVARTDAFPQGKGREQHLAASLQHQGTFLQHQAVLTQDAGTVHTQLALGCVGL